MVKLLYGGDRQYERPSTNYAEKIAERFFADCKSSGAISDVEIRAAERLLDEWDRRNLLAKFRYVNLFIGEGNVWRKNLLPFGTAIVDIGAPTVNYLSKTGLSVAGSSSAALRTGFTPTSAGIGIASSFRAAYMLQPATSGVVFGGGNVAGSAYTGNYLGLANGSPGLSRVSGTTVQFDRATLGLQSFSANSTTIVSQWRYQQTQSVANPALAADAPNQGSLLLNHFNGPGDFSCNGRIGAAIEGVYLSPPEVNFTSATLDRFNFEIGRKAALSGLFFGDSITAGVGVSNPSNRYSTQVVGALGIAEINKGVSGSCAQSGSGDGIAIPAISRYIADVINQVPAFVFILLGANDVYRGADYTPAGFQRSLEQMIDGMVNAGIYPRNIFLATLPYTSDNWYSQYPIGSRQKALEYFNTAFRVAESRNTILVDVYSAMVAQGGNLLLQDGLHPNDAGAQVIAQAFVRAFEAEIYS